MTGLTAGLLIESSILFQAARSGGVDRGHGVAVAGAGAWRGRVAPPLAGRGALYSVLGRQTTSVVTLTVPGIALEWPEMALKMALRWL